MFTTKPSTIVQKKYKSPFLFAFYYAFGYLLFVWSVFLIIEHTPLLYFDYVGLLLLGICLLAIPYYYLLKKNCDPLYPLCSFFALLIIAILLYQLFIRIDNAILRRLFPSAYVWNGPILLELIPMFVAPVVGALTVIIDTVIYVCKSIYRAMAERESRR